MWPLIFSQKIEVIDEDEEDEDDDDGDFVASDLEQMQNLLEFKVKTDCDRLCAVNNIWSSVLTLFASLNFQHEEVQFLENELENQKQKYLELASFTKSLLSAVRNNDLVTQQVQWALHRESISMSDWSDF